MRPMTPWKWFLVAMGIVQLVLWACAAFLICLMFVALSKAGAF